MADNYIKVSLDYHDTIRGMNRLMREQMPFAFARALTITAKDAQGEVQQMTGRRYELHSRFIPNNIKILPARKSDIVRYGIAEAAVYTGDRIRFMDIHEDGGERKPVKGHKTIPVPGKDFPAAWIANSGAIKRGKLPKTLLQYYNATRHGGKGRKSKTNRAFLIEGRGGRGAMVVKRLGTERLPLEVLYQFVSKVDMKGGWKFEEAVVRMATLMFAANFRASIKMALGT